MHPVDIHTVVWVMAQCHLTYFTASTVQFATIESSHSVASYALLRELPLSLRSTMCYRDISSLRLSQLMGKPA